MASEVFTTDRPDGRFLSTVGSCYDQLKHAKPKLAFDPGMAEQDFAGWQYQVRHKLHELMGFPEAPPSPSPKLLWQEDRDGYELQKWETYPEPGCVVPILMLVPDGASDAAPRPAVLCFPGSQTSKELSAGEPEIHARRKKNMHPDHNQMAVWYARAGMVAVVVDNPATGELLDEPSAAVHDDPDAAPAPGSRGGAAIDSTRVTLTLDLIFTGRSYVGLSVSQKMRILEWVRDLPFVDPLRTAVSGLSLGTQPAMVMGVLDAAIGAVVFNDFCCNYQQRFAVCCQPDRAAWHRHTAIWHCIPGLLEWFDFPDLLAALAPRPLLMCEGGVAAHLDLIHQAYKLVGAEQNLSVVHYPKYARPEDRQHDFEEMPTGLTVEEYLEYANVDVGHHYFKEDVAVPWLSGVFAEGDAG